MSKKNVVLEAFDDIAVEPGPGEVDVDASELQEICDGMAVDHDELCQVLDEAKAFQDVSSQLPEGTVLTISEEKILNAMVNFLGAGSSGTISAENLKVFKRDTEGTTLSLEALEGGVWATIKRIIEAIVAKIRQFWNWLTSGGEKKIEETQKKTETALKTSAAEEKMATMVDGKVAVESFEYEKTSNPNINHISGARLARFTNKAPTNSMVILEDVVEDMGRQMEIGRKFSDGFSTLDNSNLTASSTDQQIITKCAEYMGRLSTLLGLHNGGEIRIVGTTYLKYDPKELRYSIETKDQAFEHGKNYIIALRSPREVVSSYTKYVNSYREAVTGDIKGSLKKVADEMAAFARGMEARGAEGVAEAVDKGFKSAGSDARHSVAICIQAAAVLMSAFARLTHTALDLEASLFHWLPKAA